MRTERATLAPEAPLQHADLVRSLVPGAFDERTATRTEGS